MNFKAKELEQLQEIDISPEEYFQLYNMLTQEERAEMEKIKHMGERVKRIAEALNDDRFLPKEFKHLVGNYKAYEGLNIPIEIKCY